MASKRVCLSGLSLACRNKEPELIHAYNAGMSSTQAATLLGLDARAIRTKWSNLLTAGKMKPRSRRDLGGPIRINRKNDPLLKKLYEVHKERLGG